MKALVRSSLLLVIVLVSLSAYLRLAHSGLGCADWPACYGRIGAAPEIIQPLSSENAYQRILAEASQPLAWATPLHRLVASVLGLLIVFLVLLAFRRKRDRLISMLLLGLTVFLALLGLKSGSLHSLAVVMGNLAGGFLMLGLLGWLLFTFDQGGKRTLARPVPALAPAFAILLLVLQILLGGLTSANFAATACRSLPDCHGSWLPGPDIRTAMDLTRERQVTPQGLAVGGQERIDIHIAHRLGAVAATLMVLVVGYFAWQVGGQLRFAAGIVLTLAVLEFAIGLAAVVADLPIGLAVAHNWLAGLLLLGLLKVAALNHSPAYGAGLIFKTG